MLLTSCRLLQHYVLPYTSKALKHDESIAHDHPDPNEGKVLTCHLKVSSKVPVDTAHNRKALVLASKVESHQDVRQSGDTEKGGTTQKRMQALCLSPTWYNYNGSLLADMPTC